MKEIRPVAINKITMKVFSMEIIRVTVLIILCLGSCLTLVNCDLIRGPADVVTVKDFEITLPCSTSIFKHIRWEFKRLDALDYEPIDLDYKRKDGFTGNTYIVGNRYLMKIDPTGSEYNLTIWRVQTEDAGTYRCVEESRSDDERAPDHRSAEVVVADEFSCTSNYYQGARLHVGYPIKMTCTLTNIIGNKNPTFRWSVINDESDHEVVLFHPESRTFYNTEGRNKTMISEVQFRAMEGLNKTFVRCSTMLRETNSLTFGISHKSPNSFLDFKPILIADYFIGSSLFEELFTDDFLIVCDARYQGLFQIQISTGKVRHLTSEYTLNPVAVDIDPTNMDVYYTDVVERTIVRFSIKTQETKIMYQDLEGKPVFDGLILDVENQLMYVSDAKEVILDEENSITERRGSIIEFGLDGELRRTIIKETGMCPRALQLDNVNSVLYWTDWGGKPGIYKISLLRPVEKIPIITTGIVWPNAFVVDFKKKEMFWADAHTNVIETARLDGSNRRVLRAFEHHIFGMTLTPEYLFFTDWTVKAVGFYDRRKSQFFYYKNHAFKHLHGITHYQSEDKHWSFS